MSTERPGAPGTKSGFHIPSLDGIRACAFLLVFMGHAGVPGIPAGFGVTVFFFLSGYLITTLLRQEVNKTGRINFKSFYLRRTLRILPPFYLVLCLAALVSLTHLLPGKLQLLPFLSQTFHYSNYWGALRGFDGIVPGTAVYWSLAVEEHFYALFPALYALLLGAKLSGRAQRAVFVAICLGVLVWRCVLVFGLHVSTSRTFLCTDTRLDALLVGCALAVAGNPVLDEPPLAAPSKSLVLALLGSVVLLLLSFTIRDDRFRETLRYTLQCIALYPIFYASVRFPKWALFPVLNSRALGFIGKLSYALYLVHATLLLLLEHWFEAKLGPYPRAVLGFALSLALAWTIWTTVEKPAARLRKKLERA
jgi:peptidoglycan/LPS O-acetylase OafA/YrhL